MARHGWAVALLAAAAALAAARPPLTLEEELDLINAPVPSHVDPAIASEWEEWRGFLRMFVEAQKEHEAAQRTGAAAAREPDTNWLKTCAGWTAQEMCSSVFGAGIPESQAAREDVGLLPSLAANFTVDYDDRSVTAWCLWNNPLNQTYKSIFRDGIGCTLVEVVTEAELRAQDTGDQTPPPALDPTVPWPVGEGFYPEDVPAGLDLECVARAAQAQFDDELANPRAIVVVYKGTLAFERYDEGITKDTRLLGWSSTKSLTQSLIGVLVGDGRLSIHDRAPVPWWHEDENDPRQSITIDMMLRMSSGTRWVGGAHPHARTQGTERWHAPA